MSKAVTLSNQSSIVLVINSLQGGGAERSVMTLGQGFFELGYAVHIVTFSKRVEYELNPNLHYHLIDYKKYRLYPLRALRYRILAKVLQKYIAQYIPHCQLVLSNLVRADRMLKYVNAYPAAHIIRNTFSQEYKTALHKHRDKTIRRYAAIYANHVCVCVSRGVEEDFKQVFGDQVKTVTIYNAFDQPLIESMASQPLNASSTTTDTLSQDDIDTGFIVHVGKFKYAKGHDVLIQAYAQSSQQYPLVLLGKGSLFEPMQQLARELGVREKIRFLGFDKNPYPYIRHAKAMILSSRFEGFVRVVAEALVLGTPVISTDCPSGPNEMLPACNLVAVDDVEAMAAKMTAVMADPAQYFVGYDNQLLPSRIAQQYVSYFGLTQPLDLSYFK